MQWVIKILEDQLTKCQLDLEAATTSKTESDRQLESSKTEVQRLQQDLQAAASDRESVSRSLADRSAEVQRLTSELEKLSSEKTAAEQCSSEHQTENERLKTQLEQVFIRYCLLSFGCAFELYLNYGWSSLTLSTTLHYIILFISI